MVNHEKKMPPKRIILMRHGESAGNVDAGAYATTPDHKIPLTEEGRAQAREAGKKMRALISTQSGGACGENWRVYFYVSPYERTRTTLREVGKGFSKKRVIGVREECRIREQDFGNFQVEERMRIVKETRERFGRFFYRFPEGESAADVYDRVSSFLESMWRDVDMNRHQVDPSSELNLVIVSHGLTSRVFLTKWFKWTVEEFERLNNFGNCEFRVMELGASGEYTFGIHHTEEEMLGWGMSKEMIDDQMDRVDGCRVTSNDSCSLHLHEYFDLLDVTDDEE
ncbi:PREDICTED: phosphoglycerate mutase-like protein AT74H [Camelina sativa]|uniref:Phosphoglycerate mutase-like protein AT74H n=1 Tax=Camelina sativa TaxID=90675 RepID=A0ABM0WSY9_CAMSA|nr:PREDICTED: phosphoglycerate mutase-like protein AT74H [Camelina sativa]